MMKPIKRVEIIVDDANHSRVLDWLDENKINGYTVMRDALGKGDRGRRGGDGLSGEFSNCYILIAASEDETRRIVDGVRPILKTFGGVCLISDAQWLLH